MLIDNRVELAMNEEIMRDMVSDTCEQCGTITTAEDRENLVAGLLEHYSSEHPEWGLQEIHIRNFLDAKDRLNPKVDRHPKLGEVNIERVRKERVQDALKFFDRDAYAGNPQWAACYCMFFHREEPMTNNDNPWRENRSDLERSLTEEVTVGYLAYVDGEPAAWLNASPRSSYPLWKKGKEDDEVGVIACFAVAPAYRRHGLSKRLVEAAIEGFASMGIRRVEAHPHASPTRGEYDYHGPLKLYLEMGFTEVERDGRYVLVARDL